jgi:hypothetical protein
MPSPKGDRKKPKAVGGASGGESAASVAAVTLVRVARDVIAATDRKEATPAPDVPVASIAVTDGAVTVSISFGQAQHAKYTIQLFDPTGATEIARQSGLNTDNVADQFTFQTTPTQLDQHLVQWSGLISAFSPAPGQMFSVTFEVTQRGSAVPGGRVERTGALNVAQPFIGLLRLLTR